MSTKGKQQTPLYIYAIIDGRTNVEFDSIGVNETLVYTIPNKDVAAVVSETPLKKIRPERRNLAAHQAVLKRIMEQTTPLPVAFGIIANNAKAVEKMLTVNKRTFLDQLAQIADKVEMGLRIVWDVPNIFEYFVHVHPDLRVARDVLLGTNREPSQENKIELGRLFDRLLNEDREEYADRVEAILGPSCAEIKKNEPRSEREAVNLACLVERQKLSQFETAVFEAARLFDNNFAFDYSGPWAPHNFVNIELQL
jgi:hypothetical protein